MAVTASGFARANWDEIPDNPKFPRPPGYRHPWPTDVAADYHSRDLDGPLGLQEMSVVWVRIGPGQSGTQSYLTLSTSMWQMIIRMQTCL